MLIKESANTKFVKNPSEIKRKYGLPQGILGFRNCSRNRQKDNYYSLTRIFHSEL